MEILEFLKTLDPQDDEHWTRDGLPRIELVRAGLNNPEVSREMVTEAAPLFSRLNPQFPDDDEDEEGPAEDELAEAANLLQKAELELDRARLRKEAAQKAHDDILIKQGIGTEPDHLANQRNIMAHLASQAAQRAEQGVRRRMALSLVDVDDLRGRSYLDEAMAARRGRGTQRPQYPIPED